MRRLLALCAATLLLAACGSGPVKPGARTPTGGTSGGGYYLTDGPGSLSPAEVERIPDAVPRPENPRAANSRPYVALGKQYVPMQGYRPYKVRGIASWYGTRYHGNQTASGEPYDMYAMTAAHTTLPIPSYARVSNPQNGRSVVVRINDRGPFLQDRLIDLSYAAAYKLGIVQQGSAPVDVEWIDTRPETLAGAAPAAAAASNAPASGVYVQVGAFQSQQNAERLRDTLLEQNLATTPDGGKVAVQSWYNDGTYRVRLGPYADRVEADQAAVSINRSLGTSAIVVLQSQ